MIIEDITWPNGVVDGREIVKASFEEWLAHVFDHPPQKGSWWWNEEAIDWNVPPSDMVAFLTKTFEEAASTLKPYSDAQVAEGLWYIGGGHCSGIASSLVDESIPLPLRKKAIKSFQNLYSDCFAVHCSSLLCHLEKTSGPPGPPLNGVCYMWWDIFPINGKPEDAARAELDKECLTVMEFALGLESVACRESALHGLGHWAGDYPDFVHRVIDRFIETNPGERPELIAYAQRAREGGVL